jgi:hypothetical protein
MAGGDQREIISVADAAELAEAAADRVLTRIAANSGRIAICLTGGSSPTKLYELLATDPYRGKIPWDRVHWFIGDERFVPASDERNNMAMARRAFLDRLAPADHIHPVPTDTASPDDAAGRYEAELKSFYGDPTVTLRRCFRAIRRWKKGRAGWSACHAPMSSPSCRGSRSHYPRWAHAGRCCSKRRARASERS